MLPPELFAVNMFDVQRKYPEGIINNPFTKKRRINISKLEELSAENVGMLGIDYDYVEGKNTVQVVIDKSIFTGWNTEFEGTAPERHISIVNNNAAVYDELAVSFATKEQADANVKPNIITAQHIPFKCILT